MSSKQAAKSTIRIACDAGQPLQPVRTNCPCCYGTAGLSATNLSL